MVESRDWIETLRTRPKRVPGEKVLLANPTRFGFLATLIIPNTDRATELLVKHGLPINQQDTPQGARNESLLSTGLLALQAPRRQAGGVIVPALSVRVGEDRKLLGTSVFANLGTVRNAHLEVFRKRARARVTQTLRELDFVTLEIGIAATDPALVNDEAWQWREAARKSPRELPSLGHIYMFGDMHTRALTTTPDVQCWFEPPVAFTEMTDLDMPGSSRLAMPWTLVEQMLDAAQGPLRDPKGDFQRLSKVVLPFPQTA